MKNNFFLFASWGAIILSACSNKDDAAAPKENSTAEERRWTIMYVSIL